MGENIMGVDPFSIAIMIASTAYQAKQAKKMERAADARKGSIFSVQSEAISLPVIYGRQSIGGVQFDHKVSRNYYFRHPEDGCSVLNGSGTNGFATLVDAGLGTNSMAGMFVHHLSGTTGTGVGNMGSTLTGTKNEFMFIKHALCHGGINRFLHATVNQKPFGHRDYKKGLKLQAYPNGGTSELLRANGYPLLDKFTNVAYVAEVFRLDRDEQNFSGAPSTQYFVEGMKIHSIDFDGTDTYTLSATKTYSNNPALCLLDYLMSNTYGKGLSVSSVDLKSFYDAAEICDTTVMSNAISAGHIFGNKPVTKYPDVASFPDPNESGYEDVYLLANDTGAYYDWRKTGGTDKNPQGSWAVVTPPTRNVPLYELNTTIDTERSIRDNIEQILASMNYSELVWNSQGKYKLSLEYPADNTELNALVTQTFDKDNIMLDSFNISFLSADERHNQATVSFLNEHKDFKSDTATWPTKGSTVYNQYLEEDNYLPLETSVNADFCTDPYHALAKAEQLVRSSRSMFTVDFKTNREGLTLEPGDFITVELEEAGFLTPTVFRIQEVKINEQFNTSVSAYRYDAGVLAWNIADDDAYPEAKAYDFVTPNVTNLALSQSGISEYRVGKLTWENSDDDNTGSISYEVCYKKNTDSDYLPLGVVTSKFFEFGKLEDLDTHSVYDFKVITRTSIGARSTGTEIVSQTLTKAPGPVSALAVSEELYITNNASGVKSRALLSWSPDTSGLNTGYYLVEYKKTSESVFTSLGTVATDHVAIPDVSQSPYNFKITPYSDFGFEGASVTFNKTIAGLSAAPSDPSGFSGNINEGQINLSWDLSTDLDVLHGGSCEIRFHNAVNGSASWETSSVIVDSLTGNTNNKTVPTLKGTFFIKFRDSKGHYSNNAASFISTFFDNSFNQIDLVAEDPSFAGTKTNCSVVSGDLELDLNQTEMEYSFNNIVDLGEVISVRVSPTLKTSVTLRGVDVDDYEDVGLEENFGGPLAHATLLIKVSTTQDDPNSGSPTWTSYELLTIGSFTCRGLRFKFEGEAENINTKILVQELGVLIDKKDVIKTGSSTSLTTGDVQITFATPFYAGIGGGGNPTIGYGIIGGSVGDEVIISSRNKDGFYYSIYNSGSRVARDLDWQAIGQ